MDREELGRDGREARRRWRHMAGLECVPQGTAQEMPPQPPKMHTDQRMGRRRLAVAQRETVGWVPLAYSLCELLVCEGSVPKTKRQAVRGLDAQ